MKILIVDDEPCILEGLADISECFNWEAQCVSSGEEGLALAKIESFDIAVIDFSLTPLNGIEIGRQINCPVVIMTATVTQENRNILNQSGFAYLEKPFTISDFAKTIQRVIG